jgi:hypothetical protein
VLKSIPPLLRSLPSIRHSTGGTCSGSFQRWKRRNQGIRAGRPRFGLSWRCARLLMFGLSADESYGDYLAVRGIRVRGTERRGRARHGGFSARTAEAEPGVAGAGGDAVKFVAIRVIFWLVAVFVWTDFGCSIFP